MSIVIQRARDAVIKKDDENIKIDSCLIVFLPESDAVLREDVLKRILNLKIWKNWKNSTSEIKKDIILVSDGCLYSCKNDSCLYSCKYEDLSYKNDGPCTFIL